MSQTRCNYEMIKKAIDLAGGATSLAKKINVSYHTVLTWKNGRSSISTTNCIKIEKAVEGKIKREDILPDYPWEEFNPQEKNDGKLEIAKKMLGMGMSKENISEATGVSLEEIEKLED